MVENAWEEKFEQFQEKFGPNIPSLGMETSTNCKNKPCV